MPRVLANVFVPGGQCAVHPNGVFEFRRVSGEEFEEDRSAGGSLHGVAAVRLSLDSVGFDLVPAET